MRRMKTTTVLASLLLACGLLGCSKDKAKQQTTPTQPTAMPAASHDTKKPAPDVKADQPVSPSLSVSADIAAACGLKVPGNPTPKFDYDKDELTEDDRAVLGQIATCLTTGALKGKSVLMIGRADPRGTEEYNLGLGSRRAHSVGQYLVRLGVAQAQLEVTTRGALDATGTDEAGWRQDRRVDVQLATK
jgi:peptidoglycan-associated lipoprotein